MYFSLLRLYLERFAFLWSILLLTTLVSVPVASGQGFQIMNDRNHPHLNWKQVTTDHFLIIYPDHLEDLIPKAAAIAEESYSELSELFNLHFDRRMRIYLSDTDEISNGFAVPLGEGHTNIWVNVNDYAEIWTGNQKWLEKVIPHELAHLFHFRAVRTPAGLFNYAIAQPLQLAWAEGVAQYMTERWDSERGDRWLRIALFDGSSDYTDRSWLYNRRLMYAVGHSQVRYFAETYGDSLLTGMMAHRDTLAGVLPVHDFRSSFREAAGRSYADFVQEWRRHMNIYYHTLASSMERVDSLATDPESLPGRYLYDVKYNPDRSSIAVLSIPTMQRAQRRLYLVQNDSDRSRRILTDGDIRRGLSWHPDGSRLVYSRRVRGEHGALIHDLHLYDLERDQEIRLTRSRRAFYPAFSPDGDEIAFVANEGGTANIYLLDPENGEERPLTRYRGDVQLISLVWNGPSDELIFQRFGEDGSRHLVRLDLQTGEERLVDAGEADIDNRWPLVSPDGRRIAFTSLRDEVPNVFMHDTVTDSTWRVTRVFTGADAFEWIEGEGDNEGPGTLMVRATETRRTESIRAIPADRRVGEGETVVPSSYASWRTLQPGQADTAGLQTFRPEADSVPLSDSRPYRSIRNLTHGLSLALPYYAGRELYGVAGFTGWVEPLGQHAVAAGGALALNDLSSSEGFLLYQNRQLEPSLLVGFYRLPMRLYGHRFMAERRTGGEASLRWPINRLERSWRESWFGLRTGYFQLEPYRPGSGSGVEITPEPVSARRLSLQVAWAIRSSSPYYRNLIHPLDGYGVQLSLTGSQPWLGSDVRSALAGLQGYVVLPAPGLSRIFLYGRVNFQGGDPLPQDRVGFARGDKISLQSPLEAGFMRRFENERVRGYRSRIDGRQVAFASVEYRLPLLNSLRTRLLGLLELGTTSLVLFADAGAVGSVIHSDEEPVRQSRLGLGAEVSNLVRVGPISFAHSVGVGQPYNGLLESDYDLYYRIRAAVPF